MVMMMMMMMMMMNDDDTLLLLFHILSYLHDYLFSKSLKLMELRLNTLEIHQFVVFISRLQVSHKTRWILEVRRVPIPNGTILWKGYVFIPIKSMYVWYIY